MLNIKIPASGRPDTAVPPGVLYEIGVVELLRIKFPSRARMRTWLACSWNGCCHRPCPMLRIKRQLARMHVRIAVVGLVRILGRVVGVHQVGHGASVDQEVGGMVRLGLYVETASQAVPAVQPAIAPPPAPAACL